MGSLIYLLACLILSSESCEAYRALVVYPMPVQSHSILGNAVVKQLLNDGNEVVYLSSFEYKNGSEKLRRIDISENRSVFPENTVNLTHILNNENDSNDRHKITHIMISLVVKTLELKEIQEFLSDPKEHFDVVIVEWHFNDILSGLATIFECPLIWMSPNEVHPAALSLVDIMPNTAYTPDDITSENIALPFTFQQRVAELWDRLKWLYQKHMYIDEIQTNHYNNLIVPHIKKRGRQPPPFQNVRYNGSLLFGNSQGEGSRVPQSYKHIGGYHIDENVPPLPENLREIVENAKHGVIYFSMGTNLKSKDWPKDIMESLQKMFGELKQTVLWKFEEDMPNVPKNVHILKWAPQQSILSHPNCILFISHGGILSTTEAIHYGVPLIGVPVYGDQFVNIRQAVRKGFVIKVDLTYDIAKDFKAAIEEMLSTPKYRDRMKDVSAIYHDRPVKPTHELSHWVGHVVRTRGALHLRSPAINVPLYQRLYLDLICVLVIALVILIKLLKFIGSRLFKKQKLQNKKKNN